MFGKLHIVKVQLAELHPGTYDYKTWLLSTQVIVVQQAVT